MDSRLIIVPETDSTNLALRREYQKFPDGTLYCALNQTAGRGRLNRRWVTPPDSALCCSMLFKRVAEPYHAGAVIALAALEVINGCLGNEEAFSSGPMTFISNLPNLPGYFPKALSKTDVSPQSFPESVSISIRMLIRLRNWITMRLPFIVNADVRMILKPCMPNSLLRHPAFMSDISPLRRRSFFYGKKPTVFRADSLKLSDRMELYCVGFSVILPRMVRCFWNLITRYTVSIAET